MIRPLPPGRVRPAHTADRPDPLALLDELGRRVDRVSANLLYVAVEDYDRLTAAIRAVWALAESVGPEAHQHAQRLAADLRSTLAAALEDR